MTSDLPILEYYEEAHRRLCESADQENEREAFYSNYLSSFQGIPQDPVAQLQLGVKF